MIKKSLKFLFIVFILVIAVGIIRAVPFILLATQDNRMSKNAIFDYVIQNQSGLEDKINAIEYNGAVNHIDFPQCDGICDVSAENNRIRFDCGGYGLGSETGYTGFYYLLSDEELGENMSALGYGGYQNNYKFVPDGDGWLYKQPDGDNTVYIENIIGKFYYYLEEY